MKRLNHDNGTWQVLAVPAGNGLRTDNQAPWLPGSNCRSIPWRPRVPFRPPRRFPRAAPWGSRGNGARPITGRGTITVTSAMLALHAFAAKGTGARSIAARG
jgi:hypothetical protein